jgi:hypothetical protein
MARSIKEFIAVFSDGLMEGSLLKKDLEKWMREAGADGTPEDWKCSLDTYNRFSIEIERVDGNDLYYRYSSESGPQQCLLNFDPLNRRVWASYYAGIGRITDVIDDSFIGHLDWDIPPVSGYIINPFMVKLTPYFDRVANGYDGIRSYSQDASNAIRDITEIIDNYFDLEDELFEISASDYYDSVDISLIGLRADMTDSEIEKVADEQCKIACSEIDNLVGISELVEYLTEYVDELREVE